MKVLAPAEPNLRRIVQAINELIMGRSNATGTVTLAAGATSTTVTRGNVSGDAEILLFPKTANAAAALATTYAAAIPNGGGFVVTHANSAQTDRTFSYLAVGG